MTIAATIADEALGSLLEITPDLKIGSLELHSLTTEQVKRVMASSWKTAEISMLSWRNATDFGN